jgi:hypothetical protein
MRTRAVHWPEFLVGLSPSFGRSGAGLAAYAGDVRTQPDIHPTLSPAAASSFVKVVLAGLHREYPNKLDLVLADDGSLLPPRRLHPAFFGCFDWHSAVHGHWLLARLLRLMPGLPEAPQIREALGRSLTADNIAGEIAFLSRPFTAGFERTYGWAWLLKLTEELHRGGTAECRAWAANLSPLADAFVARYLAYLPKLDYPIRTGVHPNTAFGLAFAHDYAVHIDHVVLRELVERTAREFFERDRDYPARFEPGGADFFSASLLEADLMRRVMEDGEFAGWFDRFLPGAARAQPAAIFEPARVSDRADLQIVHLDGLNLSRAWCLRNIASALPREHPACTAMTGAADRHAEAAISHVCSGHYGGEHWLATFAVLALTGEY